MRHALGFLGVTTTAVSGGGVAIHDTLPITDNGLDAVRKTLNLMVAIIRKYRSDQTTAETARHILVAGGITDLRTQRRQAITLLQNWVRDNIVYVFDPTEVEWVQTPPKTLSLGTGDCDDKITLLLALLESVGFNTELLAVGGDGAGWDPSCAPPAPGMLPAYSHVLGAVRFGPVTGKLPPFLDGWLPLETIVKGANPGYKPAGIRVIMPRRVS
jgi:transglutaminase-like putative cysteine protease